jgi:hypothetical protein
MDIGDPCLSLSGTSAHRQNHGGGRCVTRRDARTIRAAYEERFGLLQKFARTLMWTRSCIVHLSPYPQPRTLYLAMRASPNTYCKLIGNGGSEPPTREALVRISIRFNCLIELHLIRSLIAPKASNDPIIFHTSNRQRAQVF